VLSALAARPRRRVLVGLLDGSLDIETVAEGSDDPDSMAIRLRHVHLPKLAEAGYVEWDPDTDRIRQGPSDPEGEPVLEVLGRGIEESRCE
jgi:hypothetical protein